MSSTVTSWSPDSNTKASETTSSELNNATLSGTLTVTGATQLNSTLTIGVDDTGYDVKFFGATSGQSMLWDASVDDLMLSDNTGIILGTGNDLQIIHDGSNSYIIQAGTGELRIGTVISKAISIGHTTSEVTINDNLTVTGTLTLGSGAELTEAELEMLDGITAGTAAGSKALVLDASKDIATIGTIGCGAITSTGSSTFGTVTTGVTYTQYFGISEINMGTAGYHYVMNNGMMNASPVGGDSSALGNGTDPATTLDYSALTDTDTEDIIAAYWYVPIDCTIIEVKALATTDGTTTEVLRFHVMEYTLDINGEAANQGELSSGVLKAHSSSDITGLSAAQLKVAGFTLDSADLTAGKIVIVTIEADDASDKISAQVYINYKAR